MTVEFQYGKMKKFWSWILVKKWMWMCFCPVQSLSHVWLLWLHGLQHARLPCPSPTSGAYSNLCPLRWWWTSSSSVVPFSSCLQSFPTSGSFQMSQFFASGGQSIGVSASTSVPPMNIQDSFPLGWTGWLSLQSKGLYQSSTPQFKSINSLALSFLCSPTLTSIHDYWKNHSFTRWTFVGKVRSNF